MSQSSRENKMSFCCEICWEEFLSIFKETGSVEPLDGDSPEVLRKFLDECLNQKTHQEFYEMLLYVCAKNEHKECILQAIDSIKLFNDELVLRFEHSYFILTDIDMVHAAQQKLNFINNRSGPIWFWSHNKALEKISVDVYRYIISNGGKENSIGAHVLNWGNLDVMEYMIKSDDITKNVLADNLEEYAVNACRLTENGAACVATLCDAGLCDKDTLKKHFIEVTEELQRNGANEPTFEKNLAELIEKNYICGSEICYKV